MPHSKATRRTLANQKMEELSETCTRICDMRFETYNHPCWPSVVYNPMHGMTTLEQTRFVILRELLRHQDHINGFLQHTGIFKGRESMVKLRLRVERQLSKLIKDTPKAESNQEEFYDTARNIMLEAKFGEMKAIVMAELEPLLLSVATPPKAGAA